MALLSDTQNPKISAIIINQLKEPKNYILLLFGTIYCLISLVNHYNYRTYAFDLGIYNNCLYQYGHFHKNHYPYLHYMFSNFLADHFSLYTVILSPLHYIFGSYTLLYVQILSVLFGAVGIYKVIQHRYNTYLLPEIAMMHYLAFFGIYSALSFDYHDNTVSAMLLPWFIYYFDLKKTKWTIFYAVLIVIGKENMPIWLAFVCAGLFLLNFKDKGKRNLSLILGIASLVYVVLIIKVVMPSLDDNVAKNGYNAFKYSVLGSNFNEILFNLTHRPFFILKIFFYNHILQYPELNDIKKELYLCLLYSGGFMMVIKPQYLIMLLPIIAQKVLSDDFGKWGINNHYSIEFTPIIILCFYDALSYFKNKKIIYPAAVVVCISTGLLTYNKIEKRHSIYYNKLNTSFYIKEHYKSEFSRREVKKVMKLIPDTASVSASSMFCPHLSFRKNIYQFPDVHNATYVMLAKTETAYPINSNELNAKISEFLNSPDWLTLSSDKGIYLFRRK
jgi:uncharacterized membrane protein